MKINFYKTDLPDHLLLKVEGVEGNINETLIIFLSMIPAIKTESIVAEGENLVRFALNDDISADELKNLKLSIISAIRGVLELSTQQISAAFLFEKQKNDHLTLSLAEVEQVNLGYLAQIEIFQAYITKIHSVLGWMRIILLSSIIVSALAIIMWVIK